MVTSSNNCIPFPFGSRVFLPKTSRLVASSGWFVNAAVQEHSCQKTSHSSRAQSRRQSSQPSAGKALFSPADRLRASGSGARSAVTSSGPEGTPRDLPITELSPDIVSPVQRSVDPVATQAFEARRQVYVGANAFMKFHVAPLLASEFRIPCSVTISR